MIYLFCDPGGARTHDPMPKNSQSESFALTYKKAETLRFQPFVTPVGLEPTTQ